MTARDELRADSMGLGVEIPDSVRPPVWQPSTVESAALARLHDYLRRAQPVDEHDELIARDAFMAGFQYGTRWAIRTSAALADPRFIEALSLVAEGLNRQVDP